MLIRYVGLKAIKRDTVNDPPTAYTWSEENGYVVDVTDPKHALAFLRLGDIWQPAEAPVDADAKADADAKSKKGK